ncbi:MAG: SDR family oxidoreductase [Verrucomicrobiota bacterium]
MKTALITGANQGIGLGLVQHFLRNGYRVYATARQPTEAAVFRRLAVEFGERFVPLELDLQSDELIGKLGTNFEGPTLDLLINNAGVAEQENLGEWTGQEFSSHFRVNATAPALVTQVLEPYLVHGAKVVNMTSGMASLELNIRPIDGLEAYAMSKAALNMFSRRLAEKLRRREIVVVALSPGWVKTVMGGDQAPTSVEEAVKSLHRVIDGLTMDQSGSFLSESGDPLPW